MAPEYVSVGTAEWLINNESDAAVDSFGEEGYRICWPK